MSLKTIKVNPIFLSGTGATGAAKNKTRKEKPAGVSLGAANNIKKKLISRIKNFQQAGSGGGSANNKAPDTFTDEFSNSVKFLDDLAQNKQKNTTLKKKHPINTSHISTELPPELDWNNIMPAIMAAATRPAPATTTYATTPYVPAPYATTTPATTTYAPAPPAPYAPAPPAPYAPAPATTTYAPAPAQNAPAPEQVPTWQPPPAPSYGNLKTGGTKPTYRTWLRTTQKVKPVNKALTISETLPTLFEEVDMLMPDAATAQVPAPLVPVDQAPTATDADQAPTTYATPVSAAPAPAPAPAYKPTMPKRKRITRTVKYKLGKHKNGTVSVLIKNSQTRRKIQTEQADLKQKSILDVKNFLRSKNLLKVGSAAPNDVLRQIYEQSILAGQVENKSKDTLIHNYFNEDKK